MAIVAIAANGHAEDGSDAWDVRTHASGAMSVMTGNSSRVRDLLRKARAERRVAQAQCVDGALSRVDAALRAGRETDRTLLVALDHGELDVARKSLAILLTYREANRAATRDADACVTPPETLSSDATVVKVVVDPGLPSDRTVFTAK